MRPPRSADADDEARAVGGARWCGRGFGHSYRTDRCEDSTGSKACSCRKRPVEPFRPKDVIIVYNEDTDDLEAAASIYASWGFWPDADRTYRSLMQAQPGNTVHWWAFAIVSLARDDRESYRRTCQDMLDRFGDAGGTTNGARVAWACSWQPAAGVDLKAAQKLVDPPFGDLSRAAVGALYYRTGQYSRAVEEFEKEGISASRPGFLAIVWCFRAMAYHHNGEHEKARERLAKADQLFEPNRDTALWSHQVLFQVIRKEATGVTGVPEAPESPGTSTRPTQADREK